MREEVRFLIEAYESTVRDFKTMRKHAKDENRKEYLNGIIETYESIIRDLRRAIERTAP